MKLISIDKSIYKLITTKFQLRYNKILIDGVNSFLENLHLRVFLHKKPLESCKLLCAHVCVWVCECLACGWAGESPPGLVVIHAVALVSPQLPLFSNEVQFTCCTVPWVSIHSLSLSLSVSHSFSSPLSLTFTVSHSLFLCPSFSSSLFLPLVLSLTVHPHHLMPHPHHSVSFTALSASSFFKSFFLPFFFLLPFRG